jgi:hypothetical protein
MNDQAAQTYPKHSCYEWNRQHYISTPEYLASQCGTCGHITGFMWRNRWRRVVGLFTSETLLWTAVKWRLKSLLINLH